MSEFSEARRILKEWKGNSYIFGQGVLENIGSLTITFGKSTLIVVTEKSPWILKPLKTITESLEKNSVSHKVVLGARPNCPREDLYRIALAATMYKPKSLIALGGGSTIDACKAASVLTTYSSKVVSQVLDADWHEACTIDPYFGTGIVTKMREATGDDIIPVVAVQTAASSSAHLTKYSNITDPIINQKKLIVDDAIVPPAAIFDYGITIGAPESLTIDGGLDGIAHLWEVFMGATGKPYYENAKRLTVLGFKLIIKNLKLAKDDPYNVEARTALGLGTDLGGYAIMIGGTNGGHLGSFSLVDVLSHGRACGILNPYYTVFFAPSIQDQLRAIAPIFQETGFIQKEYEELDGRKLGEAVAKGMIDFAKSLHMPITLNEVGATDKHMERMLNAAKDPQLKMKLLNMPVSLDPDKGDIDKYMRGVLEAAFTGNLDLIKTIEV